VRRESVLFLFQELAPGEKVGSILYQCRVQWVAMSLALVQLAERETSKILPLVSNLSLSLSSCGLLPSMLVASLPMHVLDGH